MADKQRGEEAKKSILHGFHDALVAQDSMPKKPNELDSTCGVGDDELVLRFHEAIQKENAASKAQKLPVTGYDRKRKASYIEYPDGRRVYGDET